jgi:hypothetical protein
MYYFGKKKGCHEGSILPPQPNPLSSTPPPSKHLRLLACDTIHLFFFDAIIVYLEPDIFRS